MAKDDTSAPALTDTAPVVADTAVAASPEVLSLDDFCRILSETVKSPELIGGFHYTERAAGRLSGTSEAYKARFDEFINKPV